VNLGPLHSAADSREGLLGGWPARLHVDMPLLTGLLVLSGLGLMVLYSATGQDWEQVEKQIWRLVLGFVVMIAVAQLHPVRLQRWSPALYAAGILLLIAVMLFGDVGKGAQRWLDLKVLRFQPSELVKIAVPMAVAWFLASSPLPPSWRRLLAGAILTVVPVLLIAKQPDLGTALLVASAGLAVLFLSGVSYRLIVGLLLAAAASLPLVWTLLRDYQKQRILTLFDPESDPLGAGYHTIQAKIAIGSGGIYGKGWLNGTQSQLEFVPEKHTDFIFAVLAEEFGLVGVLCLLTLYILIILRGLYMASQAQSAYGKLLAGALTLVFFVYAFVNVGMVIGILPVVGVPLPLVSYGGTSLVTLMAGFGILMSIHTHRKLLP
jgi:rod shape determining protein RodA